MVMSEFELGDEDFQFFRKILQERAGIQLASHKRQLVYGRLAGRIRELGLRSFQEYRDRLSGTCAEEEVGRVINALTTNVTAFMRESHHFDLLGREILPALYNKSGAGPLRIWSAGCSSGEEPYSIAVVVAESIGNNGARILATDVDSEILGRARAGIYPRDHARALGDRRERRWLLCGTGSMEGKVKVKRDVRSMVAYGELNLLGPWPMQDQFHLIFCRNVMIYFDDDNRRKLIDRFANQLVDGGYLFIGHSETLHGYTDRFSAVARTVYRRVA